LIEIDDVLASLAKKRPIFHSEADLQHALAWEIHERFSDAALRLEFPFRLGSRAIHLDLWVEHRGSIAAFELKYKTRGVQVNVGGEKLDLRDQSAQPLGRYDIVRDIRRLEQVVSEKAGAVGRVIALTNDSAYWASDTARQTVHSDFRLNDGRVLRGTMAWGAAASAGTKRGREEPITLRGRYRVDWIDYSRVTDGTYGTFRYLAVSVA